MLKRLHIKNFRSCKDVVLDGLGSLTALIGRNGSGKTSILQAIDGLARAATSTDLFTAPGLRLQLAPVALTADVECGDALYRYSFGIEHAERTTKRQIADHKVFLRESLSKMTTREQWEGLLDREETVVRLPQRSEPIKIGSMTPCLPALTGLLPEADSLLRHIRALLSFLRATRYYPIDEPTEFQPTFELGVVSEADYQQWLIRYRSSGDANWAVLMRLVHAHFEHKPKFDEFRALLGPRGLGLLQEMEVESFELPFPGAVGNSEVERRKFHFVWFRPGPHLGGGRQWLSYHELSLGTRRVIHLLAALILDDSSLLLIEHPEDGIHRGLVRKLISLLRTNAEPGQIILSSHSGVVLNSLKAEDLRLIAVQRGATTVRRLTPKEIDAAGRFIDEEGTLAELVESIEE